MTHGCSSGDGAQVDIGHPSRLQVVDYGADAKHQVHPELRKLDVVWPISSCWMHVMTYGRVHADELHGSNLCGSGFDPTLGVDQC